MIEPERPRLGVSACLVGHPVRYNGAHKRSDFLTSVLAPHVFVVAVCPEVEMGLPVPRNTLQLHGAPDRPRLVEGATGRDHTAAMERFAAARVAQLIDLGLDGFLFKRGSPSCGVEGVPVHGETADPAPGSGLFAAALRRARPDLPLSQEDWLEQPDLRERFLVQLFTHHRLRAGLATGGPTALPALHAAHRLLFAARSPELEAELAGIAAEPRADRIELYLRRAMAALALPAARPPAADDDPQAAKLLAQPYPHVIDPRRGPRSTSRSGLG
jgi:uncharacterized protein YbbK (DUF523 family)